MVEIANNILRCYSVTIRWSYFRLSARSAATWLRQWWWHSWYCHHVSVGSNSGSTINCWQRNPRLGQPRFYCFCCWGCWSCFVSSCPGTQTSQFGTRGALGSAKCPRKCAQKWSDSTQKWWMVPCRRLWPRGVSPMSQKLANKVTTQP